MLGYRNTKKINFIWCFIVAMFMTGCGRVGEKTASMAVIYAVMVLLAGLLFVAYAVMAKQKEIWFLVLFGSIIIVNTGYFALAISETLEEALLANRIAYMGSVLLPLSMLMIIVEVCRLSYKKWLPIFLTFISIFVFVVAASPGYSDIYYKEVTLEIVNGVARLNKTYGPWHDLYLVFLLGYFATMVAVIFYAKRKKTAESNVYATILGGAVFVNIGVWLIEQFVEIDFEMLSVSYIITEFFLLSLCLMIQEKQLPLNVATEDRKSETQAPDDTKENEEWKEKCKFFEEHLCLLTKTEKRIYAFYLDGKTTKEIMKELNITENTLKYHNKNIYSKLGVSSRKQLQEIGRNL